MNIRDLAIKLKNIEENVQPTPECGEMMPVMHAAAPKQPDNVNMNITMSGNGAGGIRDLMSILRNIESKDDPEVFTAEPDHGHDHADIVIGDEHMGEEYANSPDVHTHGVNAVTATGDDLASKGRAHPHKVNGGENPMQEGLVRRLQGLYEEIKEATPITVSGGRTTDATGTKHGPSGRLDTTAKEYVITFQKNPNYNWQGTDEQRKTFTTKGATVNVNGKQVPVLANPGDNLNGITGTPITVLSHHDAKAKFHRGILDASGQVIMAQGDLDALRTEYSLYMAM
jgi:hypothetical protein